MTDKPGHVWAVIQDWLDTFRYKPPSQRELAPKFGTSSSSLTEYKYARTMPPPAFLVRVAAEIRVPYEVLLDAMLKDHGYRGASLEQMREELMGNVGHPAPTRSDFVAAADEAATDLSDEQDQTESSP